MSDAPVIESFTIRRLGERKVIRVEGGKRFIHERDFKKYKRWAKQEIRRLSRGK